MNLDSGLVSKTEWERPERGRRCCPRKRSCCRELRSAWVVAGNADKRTAAVERRSRRGNNWRNRRRRSEGERTTQAWAALLLRMWGSYLWSCEKIEDEWVANGRERNRLDRWEKTDTLQLYFLRVRTVATISPTRSTRYAPATRMRGEPVRAHVRSAEHWWVFFTFYFRFSLLFLFISLFIFYINTKVFLTVIYI